MILAYALGRKLEISDKSLIREQKLRLQALEQIEENFEKLKKRDEIIKSYVSPSILTEVALHKDPLSYEPRSLKKCILFCDIRDYTTLSEKSKSEDAAVLLNKFFEMMNDSVFRHNGEVDKLIGDAVMATFDDAADCLAAIEAFRDLFKGFNENRIVLGKNPIYVGIGISYGEVLSANFGSKYKLDRTIVGDAVNVASRFDGLSKSYKVDIVCTEAFISQLPHFEFYRPLDIVKVRGRDEEMVIYEIFTHAQSRVLSYKSDSKASLEKMISALKEQNFELAREIVCGLIDSNPAHSYRQGQILDMSLYSILSSIDNKIKARVGFDGNKKNVA